MTSTIAEATTPQRAPAGAPAVVAALPSPSARFLAEIARGPLALDAGMGTRLLARGLDPRRDDPSLWNLDHPDDVLRIHHRDADAGARALLTNTFGANRSWLARFARSREAGSINRAAVALARRAAGPSGFVIGDIGPSAAGDAGAAREQAAFLVRAGVDALILETFRLEPALDVLRGLHVDRVSPRVPVIVSLWQWPDAVEGAASLLAQAGADVLGLNCRPALYDILPMVRRIAGAVACPLLVKPGIAPGDDPGRSTPSAFADAVPALIGRNVRLIGGCCGTTEDHVAAIARACAPHRQPESL